MPRRASTPAPAVNWDELYEAEPTVYVDESKPVPQAVISLVEDAYGFWLEHQNRWSRRELPNAALAAATVSEARRYCTSVRDEPLTFQTKGYEEGNTVIVYRAREAVRRIRT